MGMLNHCTHWEKKLRAVFVKLSLSFWRTICSAISIILIPPKTVDILAQAACVCCHRTKCPLLVVFFLLLLLPPLRHYVILEFNIFEWGLKSQKNKIRGRFFWKKNKKCLELPEMVSKFNFFFFLFLLLGLLFCHKGLCWGSEILHCVVTHKQNKIWGDFVYWKITTGVDGGRAQGQVGQIFN